MKYETFKKRGGETSMTTNAYNERNGYRKFYQKAALALVKKYRAEHKALMVQLGYKAPEKKAKVVKTDTKPEPKNVQAK